MKYKTKKRAALSKLEATGQNLVRVRDVIAEVERQRNSLKRQANKAERYRELDRRATELKLYLKFREHGALWEELQAILARLDPMQQHLTGLRAGIASSEADQETHRLRALELEQAVATAQEALYGLRGQIDRDEAELRNLAQQSEAARARQAESQAALAGLGERVRGLLAELETGATRARAGAGGGGAGGGAGGRERAHAGAEAALEAGVAGLEQARGQAAHQATQVALKRNELATLVERSRHMSVHAERLRSTTPRPPRRARGRGVVLGRRGPSSGGRGAPADRPNEREAAQAEAERAREARRAWRRRSPASPRTWSACGGVSDHSTS
jgi:chromosome segregation protein